MWEEAIASWTNWLRAASRPQTTIQLRRYQILRFAEEHTNPWSQTVETLIMWLAKQEWAPESRRSYRSALRSFYSWAHATGRMRSNPAALLPSIRPVRHLARPTPEVTLDQALVDADDRTRLILLLGSRQGLRRAEIAQVHSNDLMRDLGGWSLRVQGKGGKERIIPLFDDVADLLRRHPAGWVFPGQIGGHLSPRWVGTLAKKALGRYTTHTLRHRFATRTYAGSRDLISVAELLGHAKTETTRVYVQLPDDALRAAMSHAA